MNIILTKEYLEAEYIIKKRKVRDIAKTSGYSYSYIQAKIKQYSIPRRPQYSDITGQTFNDLTAFRFVGVDKRQQAFWECKCKCGNTKIVKANCLTSGGTKSCGCNWKTGYGEIQGKHFGNIKSHSKWRKIKFDLKIKDIWELYLTQKRKCALSGVDIGFGRRGEITTASLDRIDSSKGYTLDNVQWVHKEVNKLKTDMGQESFLKWVKLIAAHNQ